MLSPLPERFPGASAILFVPLANVAPELHVVLLATAKDPRERGAIK
jgi:hypothetical protein